MVQDDMDSHESVWGKLPIELIERVLSYLPVPDLCRFRSVCKSWNELICKPVFHDLCDLHRANKNIYLFVTRHLDYGHWSMVDPTFRRTTTFLDLDARRWYSIKPDESLATPTDDRVPQVVMTDAFDDFLDESLAILRDDLKDERMTQLLAMDDGLVCEMTALPGTDEDYALVVFDPVARTKKELPEPPVYCFPDDVLPLIVTSVDPSARSYKVFVVNNSERVPARTYVYESCSNEWRDLKNPPERLRVKTAVSALVFQGILYIVFRLSSRGKFVLLSYNIHEDAWKEVSVSIPRKKRHPQLVVSSNRLFMMMWLGEPCHMSSEQGSHRKFHLLLELREILIAENTSRTVVQLPKTHLQQIFGEQESDFDIAYGVPSVNSNGICNAVVLMSSLSGKLISLNFVTGSLVFLPPHSLGQFPLEEIDPDSAYLPLTYYHGKHMNLSLRNLASNFLE